MTTDSRLMTASDLIEITGKTRYSKQAAWFKERFGIAVTCRDDGSVVIAWATFLALDAKKAGLLPDTAHDKVEVCSPFA